ncbi:MAG: ATP-dependent RNA helicase DbpA [Dehalococcoidia bacterium]|nr:ATP-dependent RNA helicase DbpA [Chloroflexota bacterium]
MQTLLYFYGPNRCELIERGRVLLTATTRDLLSKGPLPEGAKWITLHPNGAKGKGVPVIIREHPDGTATVIGGAGGSLNHLHLDHLNTNKVTIKKPKKPIDPEKKKEAKKWAAKENHLNAAKTIEVLESHGIEHGLDPEQIKALTTEAPTEAQKGQYEKARKAALETVRNIQDAYEQKLLLDADARAAAFGGDVPLEGTGGLVVGRSHHAATPEGEVVAKLEPLDGDRWAVQTDDGAQVYDSWDKAASAYVGQVQMVDNEAGMTTQLPGFYDSRQWQSPSDPEFNPEAAAAIYGLQQQRREVDKAKKIAIAKGTLTYATPVVMQTEALKDKLNADAKTLEVAIQNNEFLHLLENFPGGKQLKERVLEGATAHLGEVISDVLKAPGLAPEVIAALGHNEAAKLVAELIRRSVSSPLELEAVANRFGAHHALWSASLVEDLLVNQGVASQQAQISELVDAIARDRDKDDVETVIAQDNRIYQAQTLNTDLKKKLGNAVGALQASAALSAALRGTGEPIRVTDAARIGLDPEDLNPDGTLTDAGVDSLLAMVDVSNRSAYDVAIAIKRGEQDEEDWLPAGFAYRPAGSLTKDLIESEKFTVTFPSGNADLHEQMKSYIGARVGNGESPFNVATDIRSPELYLTQGLDPYGDTAKAMQRVAIDLVNEAAKGQRLISDSALIGAFQQFASNEAVKQRRSRKTDSIQALHEQTLTDDAATTEASHQVMAVMPLARVLFKDKLSHLERRMIRDYAITEVLGEPLEAASKPERKTSNPARDRQVDIFGNLVEVETSTSETEETQWQKFSTLMGGDERAYAAVLDHLRGLAYQKFATAYSKLAAAPLLTGKQPRAEMQRLLLAKLPEDKRADMLAWMKTRNASAVAAIRSRSGGKFAAENDAEWLEKMRASSGDNRQLSLITSSSGRSADSVDWQRVTLGTQAEQQLAVIASEVAKQFEQINNPIDLYPEENWGRGTQSAPKQRIIKLLENQPRFGAFLGAGSGKSSLALGAYTHLHSQGKTKRLIAATPGPVVGQFLGECATFLEPGKYNYTANQGHSAAERMQMLTDPNNNIHLTTRESLSNDCLAIVTQHSELTEEGYLVLPAAKQREVLRDAMLSAGVNPADLMLAVDESHDISERMGVAASRRSQVLTALGQISSHTLLMTGTPYKNDLSEIHDFLVKVDPDRFPKEGRKAFMKRFANAEGSRKSLQRLLAPYSYAMTITPTKKGTNEPLKMIKSEPMIATNESVTTGRQKILEAYTTIRNFTKRNAIENYHTAINDSTVMTALDMLGSPNTWGKLNPEAKAEAVTNQLRAAGTLRDAALHALYHTGDTPKINAVVNIAQSHKGEQGVVFASRKETASRSIEELTKAGYRVGLIDGESAPADKDAARAAFKAGQIDVLVCTDAAQTGLNLQSGKWLVHADIPLTEKAWTQRSARIYRRGQTDDVKIYTPLLDVPEERIALARLERKAGEGSIFQEPSELLDDSGLAHEIHRFQVDREQGYGFGTKADLFQTLQITTPPNSTTRHPSGLDREQQAIIPNRTEYQGGLTEFKRALPTGSVVEKHPEQDNKFSTRYAVTLPNGQQHTVRLVGNPRDRSSYWVMDGAS